jgi:hypothetical protein
MALSKFQVMNAVLGSRQSRKWSEVFDSIDGQRVNFIKHVLLRNPEFAHLLEAGVAPENMRDRDGKPVPEYFPYVVWNHGNGFAMSGLGGFMEPQINDLLSMFGESAFPFSCEIEEVESSPQNGYRIKDGSIDEVDLSPEFQGLLLAAPHEEGPQALEDFAKGQGIIAGLKA